MKYIRLDTLSERLIGPPMISEPIAVCAENNRTQPKHGRL